MVAGVSSMATSESGTRQLCPHTGVAKYGGVGGVAGVGVWPAGACDSRMNDALALGAVGADECSRSVNVKGKSTLQ